MSSLTIDQLHFIYILRASLGCLTLIGSIFIFLSVVLFKRYRKIYYRLVLGLTVGAFLEGIGDVLNLVIMEDMNNVTCIIQGVFIQISQSIIFCYTTIIAVNLFLVVYFKRKITVKRELVFHGVVWTWLLFTTFLPFVSNAYGPAGAWCWITETSGQPYRWVVFYVPLVIQAIVNSVLYGMVIFTLRFNLNYNLDYEEEKLIKKTIIKLIAYPVIFIALYIFPIINRIHDAVDPTEQSFFLYMMQSATTPLYGFVAAIAYGIDIEMKDRWIACVRNLCFGFDNVSQDVVVGVDTQINDVGEDSQIVSDTSTTGIMDTSCSDGNLN